MTCRWDWEGLSNTQYKGLGKGLVSIDGNGEFWAKIKSSFPCDTPNQYSVYTNIHRGISLSLHSTFKHLNVAVTLHTAPLVPDHQWAGNGPFQKYIHQYLVTCLRSALMSSD